ncbi:MAG: NYN domain-containing protein [Ardenticatenaceae bacterium]|nr:NYN domain-containing protein [Ardenticatenaceae bacterium]
MHYLIDGHNLIAKIPDLSLNEEHDELELALKLKSWASANRKRKVTVVFDRGMPGGTARMLSNRDVTVIFAPQGQTADSLLIARIKQIPHPPEYTLVSSDQAIIAAAKKRKMRHILSEEFAGRLGYDERLIVPSEPSVPTSKPDDVVLSDAEINEWLDMFGPVPERPKAPPKRLKKPTPEPAPEPPKPKKRQPLTNAKSGERELDEAEIAEWLELFGPVVERKPEPSPAKASTPDKPTSSRAKKKRPIGHLRTLKSDDAELHPDEVADWLELFKQGKG